MRRSLVAALSLVTATGACTSLLGDFSLSKGPTDAGPDGTTADTGPSEGGEEGASSVTAVATGTNVYLGQTATVDGTQSTSTPAGATLDYAWTVVMAPANSGVGNGSLATPSAATTTFKPDQVGEYQLKLTVTSGDAPPSSALVTVYCGLPQVFYAQGNGPSKGGPNATYNVVDFDGGNAHPVTCTDTAPSDPLGGSDIPAFAAYAGRAYDFWEGPPVDPHGSGSTGTGSRLAGFTIEYSGGYQSHLWSATTASTCATGVTDLGTTNFGPGKPYGSQPHFRPDGERIAVYDKSWNILTYAWNDPSSVHNIAAYPYPYPATVLDPSSALGAEAGILESYFQVPPQIQWKGTPMGDAGTAWSLAWAFPHPTGDGGLGWTIAVAPDQAGMQPMPYVECGGVVPRQFTILPDGSIIASYRLTPTSAEDLVHLQVVGGTCSLVTNYTQLGGGASSIATDFSISPDGSTIAFLRLDPSAGDSVTPWALGGAQLPGGYLYTVPTIGGNVHQVSTQPALFGPRWIGGGAQIVFTRLDGVTAGGNLMTSVVVTTPGNGSPSVVASGDGVNTFVSTSGNAACGISPGNAARGGAGLIALVGLAAYARRRRRGR